MTPLPRPRRRCPAGLPVHVLSRANGRLRIFCTGADYAAFLAVLAEAGRRFDARLLAFCLMPNHWHLVLWPRADGEVPFSLPTGEKGS